MKTFEELWDYIKEDNLMGYEKSKNLYDELKTTKFQFHFQFNTTHVCLSLPPLSLSTFPLPSIL